MNRLAPTLSYRVISIAATVWLLSALDTHAQFELPTDEPANASPVEARPAQPTLEQGTQLVTRAKAALQARDYQTAVQAYRQAAALVTKYPQLATELKSLRAALVKTGIDAQLLAVPTQQPVVTPMSPVADRKREALRMLALGRAALDRGEVATALQLGQRAESLQVPESQFAAGEPRVWEFVLDVESAARRHGLANAAATTSGMMPGAVQPAVGAQPAADFGDIAQTLFNNDAASTGGNAIAQVQNEAPLTGNGALARPGSQVGEQLVRAGLEALSTGNKTLAREKFVEAWKYEGELDLATRAQLQDKLTLLQPSKLPSVSPADSGVELTPIQKAQLESAQQTQRLFREVTTELAKANELRESEPLKAADDLASLLRRVDAANIDENAKRRLASMVNEALTRQQQYVEANRAQIDLDLRNESIKNEMAIEASQSSRADEEITLLVEKFNDLVEQQRYHEAEVVAKQVAELKPGSTIAISMIEQSRMKTRLLRAQEVRAELEDSFVREMRSVEESAISGNPELPLEYADARYWNDLSQRRLRDTGADSRWSPEEREIRQKLQTKVEFNYNNRPLNEVLSELAAMTNLNILMDSRSLATVRVEASEPITKAVSNPISLRSALNHILGDLDCSYVIEDEAVIITSNDAKGARTETFTYRVADLVTPIPNFTTSYDDGLAGALRAAYQMASPQADVQIMPVSPTDLGSGMAKAMSPASIGPNMLGQYHPMGSSGGFGASSPAMSGRGGATFADFDSLMQLIQTTIVPDTWEALGGPSTMAPYSQNLSLVISTTSDVHDQIADLLESLRRLQNLQITIEVRFITLADSFFEQIGIDFDVQFDDNLSSFPQDDSGQSVTIGFGGDGLPTPDLDIRFDNNSFGIVPPFPAFDAATASTFGWALLSDIEAFFFLQAAQGDSRNNVMQAPKVTLFDGQFASISDVSQRPFVTSITPVVGDFAVAQQPVIVVLNEGTQLNVQGVVSEDKRFVRLTLVPFFSQIGDVDTFTFEGQRRRSRSRSSQSEDTNGDGVVDEDDAEESEDEMDVIEGTTVQLPQFAFTSVSTTVSVPDGGTILLGGIKRLAEGREERGVPMLSKIPYLSRLFRNVSVGRDATSLMLMVTPRIIIQEEEEIAQTGYDPRR